MISPGQDKSDKKYGDRSFTAASEHSTAADIGKQYAHEFTTAADEDMSPFRKCDGQVSSGEYAGRLAASQNDANDPLDVNFHHQLEKWLGRRSFRWLLKKLTKPSKSANGDGPTTPLERIIATYGDPGARRWDRIKYWPLHRLIDHFRGKVDIETFRHRLAEHKPTVRGLVVTARSIAEFGLTVPQKFSSPLFAVWNLTNRCNLACKHCYQDSDHSSLIDELTLDEKLDLVDQMGRMHMPMIALSGGEPTVSPDLLPVVARASSYGMHISLATNGTVITPDFAGKLAEAGARYIEISLDSVDPDRHDSFRGTAGMWRRSVAGAKAVVATEGLRLGIAMCVHQGNIDEVDDMIAFAEELGAGCFAHFNFIPVGRGLKMVQGDITPQQREQLLSVLNKKMQAGGMGVISTAPQLRRQCLVGPFAEAERMTCSHAGSGSGDKARVVAKYLGGCGAGRTYICIQPNGNITPCVYIPHRVMGNVREAKLVDIFRGSVFWDVLNDRDKRLHHCRVCSFRNYCGGCRARADAYYGQLHAGDPGCIFNSKHWDKLVEAGVAIIDNIDDEDTHAAEPSLTSTHQNPAKR